MPCAASCESSRNGEPGSSSARTRSRGRSLPRATCFARRGLAAALLDARDLRAQVGDQRRHRVAVPRERRVARVELRFDDGHGVASQPSVAFERRETRGEQHEQRADGAGEPARRARHARGRGRPARAESQATGRLTNRLLKLKRQPSAMNASAFDGASASMNCGRNARKNSATFGIEHVDHERFAKDPRRGGGRKQRARRRLARGPHARRRRAGCRRRAGRRRRTT